jgi:hypothetical protein
MVHMERATRRRPGPEGKGERKQVTLRVPAGDYTVYEREASAARMPVSDYLALALARQHQLDEPAYLRRAAGSQMLPLTG